MTPEDAKTIAAIVRQTETDMRSERDALESRLVVIELALLPIAMIITIFLPAYAASVVFMPNLVLRAYQVIKSR